MVSQSLRIVPGDAMREDIVGARMTYSVSKVSEILDSLSVTGQEDLPVLHFLVQCAQSYTGDEATRLMEQLPVESRRQLHALVEALNIYESIQGHSPVIQSVEAADASLRVLKKLRELCLEGGLGTIY